MTDGAAMAPLLPWTLVAKVMAVFAAPMAVAMALFGPSEAVALVLCGVVPGFGAMAVGKRPVAFAAMGALLIATGLIAAAHVAALGWAIAACLAATAGVEAARFGGRAFVLALIGLAALIAVPTMPPVAEALPFVTAGLVWGALAAGWLKLEGLFAPPPRGSRFGASLALFLGIGLAISAALSQAVDAHYGYWIVLLFVFRALSPDTQGGVRLRNYALGATLGSLAALLALALHVPAPLAFALALVCGALALRHLARLSPVSAAAATASVLLVLPVDPGDIVFRIEAALGVVALAALLVAALSHGWRRVDAR